MLTVEVYENDDGDFIWDLAYRQPGSYTPIAYGRVETAAEAARDAYEALSNALSDF